MSRGRTPSPHTRAWLAGLLLAAGAWSAVQLQPRGAPLPASAAPDLETIIPQQFARWRVVPHAELLIANRALTEKVEAVYASTLERVYVDAEGHSAMLSIAYGSNQLGDGLQAHRPEYCYRAQGFEVGSARDGIVRTAVGNIPARRLVARAGMRNEPITYWLTIGDRTVLPGLSRELAQLRHGLAGAVPDGLLIRVSSLEQDPAAAYHLHDRFITDLLAALPAADRARLGGRALHQPAVPQSFAVSTRASVPGPLP